MTRAGMGLPALQAVLVLAGRGGRRPELLGLAYYQDYVFYDASGGVLVAYRTLIQRSVL